jgi:hypothetical protein
LAASTASAYQLAWAWLTPQTASRCEKSSPYGDSSWWIRPALEKLPERRYDLAASRAWRWPIVEAWAELASDDAARTAIAAAHELLLHGVAPVGFSA